MQWFVTDRNNFRRLLIAGLFCVLTASVCGQRAFAVTSEIGVNICDQNTPGASISISEPINDSVVNRPVTTFRGTVAKASQIEITIDGTFADIIALGANQTMFQKDITLGRGTHTVMLTANDVCGGADASDSVVLTYQPAVEPSNGKTTPTEVAQEKIETVANPNAERALDNIVPRFADIPVIGSAVSVVADFASAIGLPSTVSANNASAATGAARIGVTVVALTSVVMASTLAPIAAQALPGISETFNISSSRSMLYLGWVIRGAGVLMMALAYFV